LVSIVEAPPQREAIQKYCRYYRAIDLVRKSVNLCA
jgi:hypothetical protein